LTRDTKANKLSKESSNDTSAVARMRNEPPYDTSKVKPQKFDYFLVLDFEVRLTLDN
jgi:hypothetical protein